MCFGGGGWNPLEDIKKLTEDPVGTITSAIVNASTGGLVGVKDGQLAPGVAVSAAKEGVGEITGANAARKAAMQTQDAINAATSQAEKERRRQLQLQEANERQLSNRGAARSRQAQGGGSTGASGIEQQMATDFLGL